MFGRYMINPIKHVADWIYIRQIKQAQIEKYIIRKNSTKIKYDRGVWDQLFLINKAAYKYENQSIGTYEIFKYLKT